MATLPRMLPSVASVANAVRALLDGGDLFATVHSGAHFAATSPWSSAPSPTKAQEESGIYPMGHVSWCGHRLCIENPAQTIREGVGEDGKPWRSLMLAHYGFFAGTVGADGEGVDVMLGPFPESPHVWVVNQTDARGQFDEHKVLAGFVDQRQAVDAYRLSYTAGWDRYGAPIHLSLAELRWWLSSGDTKSELSRDQFTPESQTMNTTTPQLNRVFWDSEAMPLSGQSLAGVLYSIRSHDAAEGLVMDSMTMADLTEGAELVILDALVTQAGRLAPKMAALMRIMEAAGGDVKPLAYQLSEPMRRYGGVHVAALFELSDGQTMTVWFHNPDSTPAKLTPADDLVSWKWLLNKKDVTIVVAPEKGTDLNLREVARRTMRLAAKNSAAFAKANAGRAAKMAEIQALKDSLTEKQGVLAGLNAQIEVAKVEASDRDSQRELTRVEQERADGMQRYNEAADLQSSMNRRARGINDAWTNAMGNPPREGGRWAIGDVSVFYSAGDIAAQQHLKLDLLPFSRWTVKSVETVGVTINDDGVQPIEEVAGQIVSAIKADVAFKAGSTDPEPVYELTAIKAEGFAIGKDARMAGATSWLPEDSNEFMMAMGKYVGMPDVVGWLREGFTDGWGWGDGSLTSAEVNAMPETDFVEWEDKLTTMVEFKDGATRSDAQGMVEAVDLTRGVGTLRSLFDRGVTAEDAYDELFGSASSEKIDPTPPPPAPNPAAGSFDLAYLRDVNRGAHDSDPLGDMLARIEEAIRKLEADGLLTGDADTEAGAAITRWVQLDEKVNG